MSKAPKAQVERLENYVAGLDLADRENHEFAFFLHNYPQKVNAAVAFMAKQSRTATLAEILAPLSDYGHDVKEHRFSILERIRYARHGYPPKLLEGLYRIHADLDGIAAREDNLLVEKEGTSWKDGYARAASAYVLAHGWVCSFPPEPYGLQEYTLQQDDFGTPVAAFALQDMSWSEFEGTGITPETHTGFSIEVVYSSGYSREVIWEGDFQDFMKSLVLGR